MSVLPTAEEALKLTQSEIAKQSSKLLEDIVKEVHTAACNFKTEGSISLTGRDRGMVEYVCNLLRSSAYEVQVEEQHDPREGSWTTIKFSWGKKK